MNVRVLGTTVSLVIAVTAIACSSAVKRSGFETETDPTEATDAGAGSRGFEQGAETGTGSPCAVNNIAKDPEADSDGDGFPLKYDCNECDPNVNNGAFDVPGNNIDEDCNGVPDDEPADCDDGLALASSDAFDGAKAIGLCKKATDDQMWGVVEATWVKPDGSPQSNSLGQGILTKLGVNAAQAGKSMLAVSSGSARDPVDPGYESVDGSD